MTVMCYYDFFQVIHLPMLVQGIQFIQSLFRHLLTLSTLLSSEKVFNLKLSNLFAEKYDIKIIIIVRFNMKMHSNEYNKQAK